MADRIVREHPALFLGELREDLERVYALNDKGERVLIKLKDTDDVCIETLIEYPNENEYEIVKK